MAENASPAFDPQTQGRSADGARCGIKPHKPLRDANGQIRLTHLTEKGG
jgi:hypothetical protein